MDSPAIEHTFAVCAYMQSPYLEECILSLVNQRQKSKIIMSTSTDNDFIRDLSVKYNITLYINYGKGGMQDNWNFAYSKAETPFVTIVHQDDYYHADFSVYINSTINKYNSIILIHTNYNDVVNGRVIDRNLNNRLRCILNFPIRFQLFARRKFFRRLALSFGNSICCPSVTYNKRIIKESPFHSTLVMAVDWDLYYSLAKRNGTFVYISKALIYKRLHRESETNGTIQNGQRYNDDLTMFKKIWPEGIAKIILNFYKKCYGINDFTKPK